MAVTFLDMTDVTTMASALLGNATTAIFGSDNGSTLGSGVTKSCLDSGDCGAGETTSAFGGANNTTVFDMANTTAAGDTTTMPSVWSTVIISLLAGCLCVVTIMGNITVLLAFGLERTIRQPTNYFLASLAVSDLLIGTFSMPLYTQYLLRGYSWPLGVWLCDLWLSLDWTVCLTSQYTVFLITMDRFLSVKIPAKYRNWRTERKVIVMIAVTWILPATVFFTSVIGWQYFVGERKGEPTHCEVQFMTDAMFTFLLTIGYFWITLTVMCCLYAGIYKVALDLQRKSDAKHKKMQHTMELAGDNPQNAIRSFGEGGSNNNSSGAGDSQVSPASQKSSKKASKRKSVKAALPIPAAPVNTTSFSSSKQQDKDDDRSSSPAFASDDENSSSGGAAAPPAKPSSGPPSYNNKSSSGIAGGGVVNSVLFTNTGGLVRSLHGDLFFSGVGDTQNQLQPPPPPYTPRQDGKQESGSDTDTTGKQQPAEVDSVYSSAASDKLEKQTVPLIQQQQDADTTDQEENVHSQSESEINRGCRFIDEKSLMATLSESAALLPAFAVDSEIEDSDVADLQASSPIWKRRSSLPPLASDVFDIEEDVSDCGITADMTTTMTTCATATPVSNNSTRPTSGVSEKDGIQGNGHGDDHDSKGTTGNNYNNSTYPNAPPSETNTNEDSSRSDTHCLSAVRPRRNKDTRLHTFVKSVRSRNSRRRNRRERKSKSENRARKALRTISFILGAFVLCWTPYHVNIMVYALCNSCFNATLYSISYWLCYLNSPINPFCYAFANAQFKRTFLRIMRFDWHRT